MSDASCGLCGSLALPLCCFNDAPQAGVRSRRQHQQTPPAALEDGEGQGLTLHLQRVLPVCASVPQNMAALE
ncbi:hypothetical protein NDU88_001311 [Pleurodeles waltl]|uniref:Uncharacterized protein n=1 Tax=Pleurodeles waltl TaxID=8319 RepID=A0AAV7V976_PLEWA|nr:hypothetical protein NDU88_001311 [Pleurodeles waltl]